MSPPVEPELRRLQELADALRSVLHQLEPTHLGAEEAGAAVRGFAEIERLAVAGKTLAARQVERSGAWRMNGYRTAAHWMASITGVPVGHAVGALETARKLEELPETSWAFANGELSEAKVREVAQAADAAPSLERELLQAARTETVTGLKETCRRVRATAAQDEAAAHDRIHVRRYLRHWTDPEGAMRLEARLTPEAGARVLAGLEPHKERIFSEARKEGRKESSEAYTADALVALAEESSGPGPSGPRSMVHVRLDHSALVRGHVVQGETCEITGVGPIPVAAARALAADASLKVLVTKGADVTVAHMGRTIPARVRTALEARDPTCVCPGATCGAAWRSTTSSRSPTVGQPPWPTWPGCVRSTTT